MGPVLNKPSRHLLVQRQKWTLCELYSKLAIKTLEQRH